MALLKLGCFDQGAMPSNLKAYFKALHNGMAPALQNRKQFRDNGKWYNVRQLQGSEIKTLQSFLKQAGFMPYSDANGAFDYLTLSATRLFQEYVRTVEKETSIGKPDGVVGSKTWQHINRWKAAGKFCEWDLVNLKNPTTEQTTLLANLEKEHDMWIRLMKKVQTQYLQNPPEIVALVDNYPKACDTKKLQDWNTDANKIHLIGIRRNQNVSSAIRANDDIFILLMNGLVFKFWGSTDPSAVIAHRDDEAFLVEGQHHYKFGWHKISNPNKIYKAVRPASNGVLIFRDLNSDNALTKADVEQGLRPPNTTINIHWSGVGTSNFSAGCQVIAGKSYINHRNEVVNCATFASQSYLGLSMGKTHGAYNFIGDLVLTYAPKGVQTIHYTLGRDSTLELEPSLGAKYAKEILDRMKFTTA